MPRNIGTGIYTIPPDTEGVPDQTIESVPYNFYIHDVETDLNNPRPIIAGGTGANDADEALFNLGGEKSTQLVTNYDTHIWLPGSFRSASSATAGPVDGHAFAGIVYLNEPYVDPPTNANVVVSARDMNDTVIPSRVYVRENKANVWGSWAVADATTLAYVAATYAPIASPLFTGDARAPTPLVNDNDTTIATTAFVNQAVASGLAAGGGSVDALAYSGMQVNGSFDVSQESGTTTRGTSGYICDGFTLVKNLGGSGVVAFGQVTNTAYVPGLPQIIQGAVTTIQSTLGGTDQVSVSTSIEGWRIAQLAWGTANAQPITIGFWSAHNPAQKYSVAIHNSANNRTYVTSYWHNVADVAQYNVINVSGDTTGTWAKDNTVGLTIIFTMACATAGTLQTASTEQWLASDSVAATGQINGLVSTSGRHRLAGVVVLPGVVAIPSARSALIMRPYDQELQLCKRYYEETQAFAGGSDTTGYEIGISCPFSVEKRTVPASSVKTTSSAPNFSVVGFVPTTKSVGIRGAAVVSGVWGFNAVISNDARL